MRRLVRLLRLVLMIGAALVLGLETVWVVAAWILRLRILKSLREP